MCRLFQNSHRICTIPTLTDFLHEADMNSVRVLHQYHIVTCSYELKQCLPLIVVGSSVVSILLKTLQRTHPHPTDAILVSYKFSRVKKYGLNMLGKVIAFMISGACNAKSELHSLSG